MASFKSDRGPRKPYNRPSRAPEGQWLHDKAPGMTVGTPRPSRPTSALSPLSTSIPPTDKLLVSNLHYEITNKDLTVIFGQIGTLLCEPAIRYDRSGRSSGQAIVSFETVAEAIRAKKQFSGILAKGQPMIIEFLAPKKFRGRSSSVPNTSLINRIQKPPLLDRLAHDDSSIKSTPSSGGVGPIRSRVGAGRAQRAKKGFKKPPTVEDLDKELDAFMGDSSPPGVENAITVAGTSGVNDTAQDVEMA